MTKYIASEIINKQLGQNILNPKNKGNVRFSNKTSATKKVYWLNIAIDERIKTDYYLVLHDSLNRELVCLKIPANTLEYRLFKVRSSKTIDFIDLELSYDTKSYLVDVKSGGTGFNFNKYIEEIYKY